MSVIKAYHCCARITDSDSGMSVVKV